MTARRQLRIDTLVLRRDLWSGNVTVAPAAEPAMICHGEPDPALNELRVLLAAVLGDARPTRISRHVLPAGTELHTVTVPIVRKLLPPRLREPLPVAFACIVVPQQRDAWVIVPALAHTFYLARGEALEDIARAEIARVLAASDPEGAGLPALLPAATTTLVPMDVFVMADAAAQHASRKAAVEAERRLQAEDTLDAVGERLHARLARRGGVPIVGRDRPIAELEALLGGNDRLAVLLVGEEAVGKTALVEAWAAKHPRRAAWITSIAQLVAGASGLGEWQERVGKVLAAAELLDAVIYLDDFGALFADKPEEGGVDVASAMRRHVTGGRVRLLGEITPTALERAERRDVALLGAMTRLRLEPLDPATTVTVLEARAAQWSRAEPMRPSVAVSALAPVVELARRYLPYRAFPGKAVRFLEELRATRETERDPSGKPTALGLEEAYEAFALVTGIPAFLLRDDRELRLDDVVANLRRRMIGQDEAVRRVAETICVAKAQLGPADKPLATFLFVGPTGVGKTELARSLADLLFGGEGRLVRFDMSEYGDPWAAERLITGGSDVRDGLLTAKVREQPFCVVLLDEIEKAHPAVFDLLLQVLGEGRLTDGRGRTTFFQNAIIVMTSNLGAAGARGAMGISPATDAVARDRAAELDRYRAAVAAAFRPEMVNRIDRVIAFHRLERAEVAAVARLQASKIAGRRGLAGAGIVVDLTDAALDRLAEGGYSAQWGVRALRRHLDDALVAPLARLLGKLGTDAKGTLVHVRAAGEPLPAELPVGGQLASVERGGLAIGVHRRSRASSRRAVAGVIAASDARRAADRLMRMPQVTALVDHLGWLRGQLVTVSAQRKERRKEALSSEQLQKMQAELARLDAAHKAADDVRAEIRTIEELALTALASSDDADELVGGVDPLADTFRRRFFHVLTARLGGRDSVTLVAHGVDLQAGLHRWARALLDDAARRGYRVAAHLRSSAGTHAGWPETRSWGHPRTPAQLLEQLDRGNPRSLLLRVDGSGAGALYGLEAGTHRFRGIGAVDPCHVVVELVAMRTTFTDGEWLASALAAAWPTHAPRGEARREHENEKGVWIRGKSMHCEVPWAQYFERLEEIALKDALNAMAEEDQELEELYAGALDVETAEGGAHVKTTFTVGIYVQRKGAEQTWTALVPEAHAVTVNGSNETRLREQMVERLRDQLRSAHPGTHERFHLHPGTRLERVHLDVAVREGNETQRLTGTFPLVCVPRWIDDERQRLICFHPLLPDRWFAAVDESELDALAPHFARVAWANKVNIAEALKATGKERLGLVELTADPRSLLDEVREKPGRQRASGTRSMEAVLAKLGVDLTAQVVNGTLAMGAPREPYRAQLGRLLGGTKLRSTVLVGRPGVGKRTLVARWIGDRLDEDGFGLHRNLDKIHHVWRLSGKRLIAGMSYLGDWEKRCLALADEARRTRSILWLDDLHLFGRIGQSRQSERSLADFFRGPIGRGELTIVSTLTPEQLQRLEDDAPALASLLVRLPIQAATTRETHELLLAEIRELEQKLAVDLHPFVPRTVIELGAALFPWTALPGAAIELVRKVSEASASGVGRVEVGPAQVIKHLARTTGLAERLLTLDEPLLAAEVEAAFAQRVMGQPEALAAATDVVMKVRAGVANPARPLGVYLFTGPTGTGKTELATALAQYLYGDISRLVRFDMSELSGPDAPARLIGDRVQPEGLLTQRIREQPFSVLLLDEIEKAHPSVLSLLLQLFDEGRLTDAAGNAASFQHTVVVMTSNLGAKQQAPIGFGDHEAAVLAEVARAVREFFPPELWNRIDRVVPFRPLSPETARRIVEKELARVLARRGLGDRSVFVYASAAVKARAVAEAFDPRYGARTVKRWLEDQVASRLADELARGGGAKMRVIRLLDRDGEVALDVEPLTEAPAVPGPFTLEPLLDRAAVALEPHAAAEARALASASSGPVFARGPREAGDRAGELMWVMDRAQSRLRALATMLGGDLALARIRHRDDDDHAQAPKRRRNLDRDTALAGIAEGLLLRRHLDQLRDPDAHVVTMSLTRVGHGRGAVVSERGAPGTLAWMAYVLLNSRWLDDDARWFDVGAARKRDGNVIAFGEDADPTTVDLHGCTHVVLVLRDAMIAPALLGEHGSHVFRSLAGEPEIVRVEVTRGAADPKALVQAHAKALAAFDAAVDAGGELPPNPERILPVVRTIGYRSPLRAGEAFHVDLEDFATGWSTAIDLPTLDDAMRLAWWLRWSAS